MTKPRPRTLTIEYLHKHLRYDPASGLFIRLVTVKGSHGQAGRIVGSVTENGYVMVTLALDHYYAHVLAWFYMTGQWPSLEVDHKNRVRTDNRWDNLREVTHNEQMWNRTKSVGKSSRHMGVTLTKSGRWRAVIRSNGKHIHLGMFATEDEAALAYVTAKADLHPGAPLH